jgi:hypothetical protein
MNPMVFVLPLMIALSGVMCFVFLPLDMWLRTTVLVGDLVGAVVVGVILARRSGRR